MEDGFFVYGGKTIAERQLQPYPDAALSDYAMELDAFADYVTAGVSGPTTGYSERRTLSIVQAGYESMATGMPIDLCQRFGEL